jgi:hypothetical protein
LPSSRLYPNEHPPLSGILQSSMPAPQTLSITVAQSTTVLISSRQDGTSISSTCILSGASAMSTYPLNEGKARSRKTAHMPPSWLDTRSFPSNSSSTMSYKTMARDDTGKSVYLRTLFSTTTTTISSSHKTTSSLTPTSYPNREQNRNQNRQVAHIHPPPPREYPTQPDQPDPEFDYPAVLHKGHEPDAVPAVPAQQAPVPIIVAFKSIDPRALLPLRESCTEGGQEVVGKNPLRRRK